MPDLDNIINDSVPSKSLLGKIYDFGGTVIDYKMGLLGAGIMSSIVFGINYIESHEFLGATTAALKQGSYTFLFGGAVMKSSGYLVTKIQNKSKAFASAIIVPSIVSISLTYGMHNLKGTPEPEKSTLATIFTVFPATAIQSYMKRKQLEKTLYL